MVKRIIPRRLFVLLFRFVTDLSGRYVLVLLETGHLHVFDVAGSSEVILGDVMASFGNQEGNHGAVYPNIVASTRFAYITSPEDGQLLIVNLLDMKDTETVTTKPYSLGLVGHELSGGHGH